MSANGRIDIKVPDQCEALYGDYTKGFVAYAYDETYVYLQNTLGRSWGSMGSGRMKWTDFSKQVSLPDG